MIQSDSFVYNSTKFDPRIEILLVLFILLRLDYWKLYETICQGVKKAEKLEKQKCTSNWLKPHYSPFQIWCSHNIFVKHFSNFNPMIKILLILDSTKAGTLKTEQKQFLWCLSKQKLILFLEASCSYLAIIGDHGCLFNLKILV